VQLVEKAAMSQFNHSKLISRVSTTKKTMATDCLVIDNFILVLLLNNWIQGAPQIGTQIL
jgi:hypothetical protein